MLAFNGTKLAIAFSKPWIAIDASVPVRLEASRSVLSEFSSDTTDLASDSIAVAAVFSCSSCAVRTVFIASTLVCAAAMAT